MPRIPEVDTYIAEKAAPFAQPILNHLRDCFHEAGLEDEAIKWSVPNFLHEGKLVTGFGAFKKHISFTLWKGKHMTGLGDEWKLSPNAEFAQMKIHSMEECPDKEALIALVKQAMAVKVEPKKGKAKKAPRELVVPEDLMEALSKEPKALETFENFSYSKRKDYVEWITSAKREATRLKRLAQAVEWMAEGKSKNWKYENC